MKNQTKLSQAGIFKGSYFVACWGYDQTQYSIYKVMKTAGNSTVYVTPKNGWSNLSNYQLSEGSVIKAYNYIGWDELSAPEKQDYENRNFDRWSYGKMASNEAIEAANEVEIVKKVKHGWTYIFTLSDGREINLFEDKYILKQVRPLKKCIVNFKYGRPSVKINETITAQLDPDYCNNRKRYEDQNLYTSYHGR